MMMRLSGFIFLLLAGYGWAFDIVPVLDSIFLPANEAIVDTVVGAGTGDAEFGAELEPKSGPAELESVRPPKSRDELGTMSREDLFRLAFGRAAPERPRALLVHLIAENQRFGDVEIVYDEKFSSFDFLSPRFAAFLTSILLPDARLEVGDTSGLFNSAFLRRAGYVVDVNEQMYELRIVVPPISKALQRTNLGGGYARVPRGENVAPAYVSFYMNYRLIDRMTYSLYDYDPSYRGYRFPDDVFNRSSAVLNFDGAFASFGWVLEGSGRVVEPPAGQEPSWENFQRGDVRVVRDIVSLNSRLTLGEVDLNTELFGGGVVGGARYERNRWFFGADPRDKRNSVTFFMPRAGNIELYREGSYTDRFYLPAGHHELSGFGGQVGRNKIKLILRLEDGSIEEIPFEFIQSDPRNLPVGDLRYSAAAGLRRDPAPALPVRKYTYNAEVPAASADLLYGLHHFVSVGLAGLASPNNGEAGARILWTAGNYGQVTLQSLMSYANYERFGARGEISYTANLDEAVKKLNKLLSSEIVREIIPRLSLSLRGYWQSGTYENAGLYSSDFRAGANTAGMSGNFGFGLPKGSVSLTGGVNFTGDTLGAGGYSVSGHDYGARIAYSVKKVSFNLGAGMNVRDGVRRPYFNFGTNYAIGVKIKNHNFSASSNINTRNVYVGEQRDIIEYPDSALADPNFDGPEYDTVPEHYRYDWQWRANAGWRYSNNAAGTGAQSYSASVGIPDILSNFTPDFNAILRQSHNRADLTANYGYSSYSNRDMNRQRHTLDAVFSGSFMFADGLWAFGRPVTDGFVLANTRHNLKDATAHINRSRHSGHDLSRNGWLGAAYHNRVTPYHPTELTLTLTEAPLAAVLPNNAFYVNGTYRQGYALRVGVRDGVLLQAHFTRGGRPVSHVYVTVEPVGVHGAESAKRASFTSSDGQLQLGNLTPGRSYIVKFSATSNIEDVVIEIPAGTKGIFEVDIEVDVEADVEVGAEVNF